MCGCHDFRKHPYYIRLFVCLLVCSTFFSSCHCAHGRPWAWDSPDSLTLFSVAWERFVIVTKPVRCKVIFATAKLSHWVWDGLTQRLVWSRVHLMVMNLTDRMLGSLNRPICLFQSSTAPDPIEPLLDSSPDVRCLKRTFSGIAFEFRRGYPPSMVLVGAWLIIAVLLLFFSGLEALVLFVPWTNQIGFLPGWKQFRHVLQFWMIGVRV